MMTVAPCASLCLVHEDLGALPARLTTRGDKEVPRVRHEKTGPGISCDRIARKLAVAIRALLLENVDVALAADHVNPGFAGVVEDVVRAPRFHRRHRLAALRVEDEQARGNAAADEQPMTG